MGNQGEEYGVKIIKKNSCKCGCDKVTYTPHALCSNIHYAVCRACGNEIGPVVSTYYHTKTRFVQVISRKYSSVERAEKFVSLIRRRWLGAK